MRLAASALILSLAFAAQGQDDAAYREAVSEFLPVLSDEQKDAATFPFDDADRDNWHFAGVRKIGLAYAALDEPQRAAFLTLIKRVLSDEGYTKAESIRELEDILRLVENNNARRDMTQYFLAVYGEPSEKGPWGLRYEGHHIALHWTFVDGKVVSSSPQFFGTNPAEVPAGYPKEGWRVLEAEEDFGRRLLASLTEAQRPVAVINAVAPADIVTGADRVAAIEDNRGLQYKDMTPEQQTLVMALLAEFIDVQRPEARERRLGQINGDSRDALTFCWMGSDKKGEGSYYRIQGAAFVAEYDNTQNNANHVHTVWRDFDGDFGRDALKEHYETASAAHGHDAR